MQATQRNQAQKQNACSDGAVFRWTDAAKGVKKQFSLRWTPLFGQKSQNLSYGSWGAVTI